MVPELTKEQRIANLEKAKQMRKERTELRSQLASGVLTVCDLINLAGRGDKAASGMRVKQMISALPGYGFKKTQALLPPTIRQACRSPATIPCKGHQACIGWAPSAEQIGEGRAAVFAR